MREGFGSIRDCGPFKRKGIKDYCKRWSSPNEEPVFDVLVAAVLSAQGITWDHSPRSIYDPEQLYTALARYGQPAPCDDNIHLQSAKRLVYKIFGKPNNHDYLHALTDNQLIHNAMKLNKSAGLPNFGKKKDDIPYAFDRSYQILDGVKRPNPCVAYARTSGNNKTRLVWGYPFEMTILEGRFAKPLIDKFIERTSPVVYGLYKFEVGTLVQSRVVNNGIPHCLDYSKFDSTIPASLIRFAFKVLSTWFTNEDMKKFGWDTIINYFIETPIVMPDGQLYKGKNHGVPSGSYFTNLIDSIVNATVIFASLSEMGEDLYWRNLFIMGDDSIFPMNERIDLKQLAFMLKKYNIVLNVEKTVVGEAHFVGATWIKALPHANLKVLASKAVYPEKYRQYDPNDPKAGAKQVIYSYASSYIEAYLMVRQGNYVYGEAINRLSSHFGELTGSDQYHTEYELPDRSDGIDRAYDPTIGMRMLF